VGTPTRSSAGEHRHRRRHRQGLGCGVRESPALSVGGGVEGGTKEGTEAVRRKGELAVASGVPVGTFLVVSLGIVLMFSCVVLATTVFVGTQPSRRRRALMAMTRYCPSSPPAPPAGRARPRSRARAQSQPLLPSLRRPNPYHQRPREKLPT
jgi:hypothetical protein